MRLRRHFRSEETTGIDLAPMLDFVLNLLIFFIITAVFTKELAIQIERSGAVAGEKKEAGSILISISAEGEVTVDNRVVDVRAVRANVERLHALKPDYGVMVVANQDAPSGVLVQVADQVRQGGVDNISFGTSE
jgi:biopolymer transport protein ExbD